MQLTHRKAVAGLVMIACAALAVASQPADAAKGSKPGPVKMACRHRPLSVDTPATQDYAVQLGAPAPKFTAARLDCGSATLTSVANGHVTFMNFFASWCGPCNDEAPDLTAFYNAHHAGGVNGIGIDTADDVPIGNPTKFYAKYHWPFPSVWDTPETSNPLYANPAFEAHKKADMIWTAYETQPAVACIPTTFWLRKDGTVAVINVGLMTRADMEQDYRWAQMSQSALEADPNYLAYEALHAKCTG